MARKRPVDDLAPEARRKKAAATRPNRAQPVAVRKKHEAKVPTVTPPSPAAVKRPTQQQQLYQEAEEDEEETEEDDGEYEDYDVDQEPPMQTRARATDAEAEEDDDVEEIAAPVVFQCATCRSIFGDSYSFVSSNAELLLVTLRAVTNITVASERQASTDNADEGSSFRELLCQQCQTVLGRLYLTTPLPLDAIRGLYSFTTSAIASYQVGYPQLSLDQANGGQEGVDLGEIRANTIRCEQAVQTLRADQSELLKLREDMTKVQNLLLVIDERLHDLETEEVDSEAEQQPAAAAVNGQQMQMQRAKR